MKIRLDRQRPDAATLTGSNGFDQKTSNISMRQAI